MFSFQMQPVSRLHMLSPFILIIFPLTFKSIRLSFIREYAYSGKDDQELVALYRQDGDIRVLAELFQRYMDLLYAVCLKYLKDPEASRDAVMEIFEELIPKLARHEVTHFKGWLYTLARNYCLMQLRSRKIKIVSQEAELVQSEENWHLNSIFEKEEQLNQLSKCMDLLSPDQKKTVELFYLQEKSYKEIAMITQTEWNAVRSLIQNARRNLKNCMDKNILPDD